MLFAGLFTVPLHSDYFLHNYITAFYEFVPGILISQALDLALMPIVVLFLIVFVFLYSQAKSRHDGIQPKAQGKFLTYL